MTQAEVDIVYSIAINIHENKWFGERKKKSARNREEAMEWVAIQLAKCGIYTIPIGMSWGVLVEKKQFDKYWKDIKNK